MAKKRSLTQLAEQANQHHQHTLAALTDAVRHAKQAGDALRAAKRQVGHGGWTAWLKANFKGSPETSRAYARVAAPKNWERLERLLEREGGLTLQDALAQLRTKPDRVPSELYLERHWIAPEEDEEEAYGRPDVVLAKRELVRHFKQEAEEEEEVDEEEAYARQQAELAKQEMVRAFKQDWMAKEKEEEKVYVQQQVQRARRELLRIFKRAVGRWDDAVLILLGDQFEHDAFRDLLDRLHEEVRPVAEMYAPARLQRDYRSDARGGVSSYRLRRSSAGEPLRQSSARRCGGCCRMPRCLPRSVRWFLGCWGKAAERQRRQPPHRTRPGNA